MRHRRRVTRASVVLATLLGTGAMGASSAAVAAASCDPSPAAAAAPSHVDPGSVRALPDGGQVYVYDINGTRSLFPVPPKGFDPWSAPADELALYGLPARPVGRGAAQWDRRADDLRHSIKPTLSARSASARIAGRAVAGGSARIHTAAAGNTLNWAGRYSGADGDPYTAVQGTWVQPDYSTVPCARAMHDMWIGLGGGSNRLIQAGTDETGTPWFEYLGNGGGVFSTPFDSSDAQGPFKARAGDFIHATVAHGNFFGTTVETFQVCDDNVGQCVYAMTEDGANAYYDGAAAEWIDERPCLEFDLSTGQCRRWAGLKDFGTTLWMGESASTGGDYVGIAALPNVSSMVMANSAGQPLAEPRGTVDGFHGTRFLKCG
jgi:hypothetical protein